MRAFGVVALIVVSSLLLLQMGVRAQDDATVAPAATDATLTLSVKTPETAGFVATANVYNSQEVEYKLAFTNNSGATVTGLKLTAPLPTTGLEFINGSCVCNVI